MKNVTRDRPLTPEELAEIELVRSQIDAELPDLIDRHRKRFASRDSVRVLFLQLQAVRQSKGLSLTAVPNLTGQERSDLNEFAAGRLETLPVKTLRRYARAVRKRVVLSLTDA